jgi:hypothetical protein
MENIIRRRRSFGTPEQPPAKRPDLAAPEPMNTAVTAFLPPPPPAQVSISR